MPIKPLSPYELTSERVIRGVANRVPFFITLTDPPFSATKIRPSGAKAIVVGRLKPEATVWISNPAGRAACAMFVPRL